MSVRRRISFRLTGLFTRWGVVKHPYGQEYAQERYSMTGRRREGLDDDLTTSGRLASVFRAALPLLVMLFLGLLTAGVLVL